MSFFFFNDTATTEIYTLSLHDALPISRAPGWGALGGRLEVDVLTRAETIALLRARIPGMSEELADKLMPGMRRSEEHTSELQSRQYLVCRLLLEKKKSDRISVATTEIA